MTAKVRALPSSRKRDVPADRLDVTILSIATALLVVGLVMNLSASSIPSAEATGSAFTFAARQFIGAILGLGALVTLARLDYRRFRGWSYLAVPLVWILLLITLLPGVGTRAGGATRWIDFGPFGLQPSEAAKLVAVVFGADVLSRKLDRLDDWRHLVVPYLAAMGFTAVLVLMQPDFGTTVIIGITAILLAYLAGARLTHLGSITAAAVIVGVPLMLSEGYRRARIFGFFNASEDLLNTGWQATQGLVALGSGGLFGVGLGASRQKYLYLPNAYTDFIFAILGEETGLVGALVTVALFGALAVLGVRAARRAPDAFGFLIASGVTAWISLQAVINIGAVCGLLPITGVPLPLISFGSSSLVFSLAGLGLVASVARQGTTRPKPTS